MDSGNSDVWQAPGGRQVSRLHGSLAPLMCGSPPPAQPQESAGSVGTASSSGSANGHPPDVPLPAPAGASSVGGGTIWPLGEGKSLSTPNPSPPSPAPPWRSTGLQKVTSLCTPPPSGNQAWAVWSGEGRRGLEPGRGQGSPLISLKSPVSGAREPEGGSERGQAGHLCCLPPERVRGVGGAVSSLVNVSCVLRLPAG